MTMFICDIPGIDPATATVHSVMHLGLAGIVAVVGVAFLGMAVRAYRRSPV